MSYKKYTIVGTLLSITSMVIAAAIPDNSVYFNFEEDNNGTLRMEQTGSALTCTRKEGAMSCNATANSTTTEGQGNSYTGIFNTNQTVTNTSNSGIGNHPNSSNAV